MSKYAAILAGCLGISMLGCGEPLAPEGTPAWTVQQASAAARRGDWKQYVTYFTEDAQRVQIEECIFGLLLGETSRRMAREEGPQSVAAVARMLGDPTALQNKYQITQEWIDEIDSLEFEERQARIKQFVAGVENPAEMWVDFIEFDVSVDSDFAPLQWRKIEKVDEAGDEAVVHTHVVGIGSSLIYEVELVKENGSWKIHEDE